MDYGSKHAKHFSNRWWKLYSNCNRCKWLYSFCINRSIGTSETGFVWIPMRLLYEVRSLHDSRSLRRCHISVAVEWCKYPRGYKSKLYDFDQRYLFIDCHQQLWM